VVEGQRSKVKRLPLFAVEAGSSCSTFNLRPSTGPAR